MGKSKALNLCLTMLLSLAAANAPAFAAKTIYVDADATGANKGSSWTDAYRFLQDALSDANSSEKPVEIRVAQGVYTPDSNSAVPDGTGDREATFQLINGVALKGGYAGFGQPDPNARDVELFQTILNGDFNGDDNPCSSCQEFVIGNNSENCYHVATASLTDVTAVIDGFTIRGGNANGSWPSPRSAGGGMCALSGSPTIVNCIFEYNTAIDGGGIYNHDSNSTVTNCLFSMNVGYLGGGIFNHSAGPVFVKCEFSMNWANQWGGGMMNENSSPVLTDCNLCRNWALVGLGGGMCNDSSNPILRNCTFLENISFSEGGGLSNIKSNPILTNCTFRRNSASSYEGLGSGGGMENYESAPTLTNCTFEDNYATYFGGGMSNLASEPTLQHCIFTSNSVFDRGGAIYNEQSSPTFANCMFTDNTATVMFPDDPYDTAAGAIFNADSNMVSLTNCTFYGNAAAYGKAVSCDSDEQEHPSNVRLINCILWDGRNEIWNNDSSEIEVAYSNVQGGWPDEGNIDADPCFVKPGYLDQNGTPDDPDDDFWVEGDYHLKSQAGRYDPNEGQWAIDEVTSFCIDAGDPMSPIGLEPFPNGGVINIGAYGGTAEASKSYFGEPPCETIIAGDINGDCQINFKDFFFIALHWLTANTP